MHYPHPSRALAFDFGASSGRAILGTFDGEKIRMEEVHRFSNDPVAIRGIQTAMLEQWSDTLS